MSTTQTSPTEHHHQSPLSPSFGSSSSTSPPHFQTSHRTSVSILDHEDPFAPFSSYQQPTEQEEEREEEDEWMRVSEDSLGEGRMGTEAEEGKRESGNQPVKTMKRSSSFLKTLWDKRLSTSSSTSSFPSLKAKISNSILKTEPPRVGPLWPRASLVSFGDATASPDRQDFLKEEAREDSEKQNCEGSRTEPSSDSLSPPSFDSYPSGSQSLRLRSTKPRASFLQPSNLNQTIGPSGLRTRQPQTLARASSFDVGELPPTDSTKAFSLLVGPKVTQNKKEVERLTGFRSSVIEAEQKLGIALTTDAPTRFVVPDNRLSLTSHSTIHTPSLSSGATDRSTLYSTTTSSHHRPLPPTSETREDSATIPESYNFFRDPAGFVHSPSSPLPASTGPLPPLPEEARRNRTISAVRFGTGVKNPSDARTKASPLTSRSSEPNLKRPLSGLFARKPRPVSTDNTSSLQRFRSLEALKPVSSSALPRTLSKISTAPTRQPRPVASLYLTAGLNRDPSKWSSSTSDLLSSPKSSRPSDLIQTHWRPEVLDCRQPRREELVKLTKEEVAKVRSQAVKLAFPQDVDITPSRTQPPATTSFFSFSISTSTSFSPVPPTSTHLIFSSSSPDFKASATAEMQLHAVALTVWSRADAKRSQAIRAALKEVSVPLQYSRSECLAEDGPVESISGRSSTSSAREDDVFWLPYVLVLVSTSPLYSLLSDALRLLWARNCHDIPQHTQTMQAILDLPLPRVGEKLEIPASVSNPRLETRFVSVVPGDLHWSIPNFPTWPFFQALHSDNILTIAELALAPLGRVLFVSEYPIMLSIATFTLQLILQRRGWNGLVRSTTHVRDLHIYLEDPGPWIFAIPSSLQSFASERLSPAVAIVDLDSNVIHCSNPSSSAVSTGVVRERARHRLDLAIGNVGSSHSVPLSIVQAFPEGKFRPHSDVEINGERVEAERLVPDSSWRWNEDLVFSELDSILSETARKGGFGRLVNAKKSRKMVQLDRNTAQVQELIRKHANDLVSRRDKLELRLAKVDHKAASLVSESNRWRESFLAFKDFSEKLMVELQFIESRLELERQEASRLSRIIEEEREYQHELENGLEAMEHSRERAMAELASTEQARRTLEDQCAIICHEMQTILNAEDQSEPLFQAVLESVETLSNTSSSVKSSPTNYRRSSFPLDSVAEETLVEEERQEALRLGVKETFAVISSRLSIALDQARQLDSPLQEPEDGQHGYQISPSLGISFTSPSSPPSPEQDRTIVSSAPLDSSLTPRPASSLSFQPKPLTLTPPVSPEHGRDSPSHPFVTPRTSQRIVSKQHSRQNSFGSPLDHLRGAPLDFEDLEDISRASPQSTGESDYDDARSFVSVSGESAGRGGNRSTFYYDWKDGSSSSEEVSSSSSNLEELIEDTVRIDQAHIPTSPSTSITTSAPPLRRDQHTRQDSFSLDAPPVELFTRSSGSIRRRTKGGLGRQGSIDLNARMRPSQVKVEGKWEPAPTRVLETVTNLDRSNLLL
ncbi:hypothetical protein JCM3765_002695 [Sporobolomyces pararoseus]